MVIRFIFITFPFFHDAFLSLMTVIMNYISVTRDINCNNPCDQCNDHCCCNEDNECHNNHCDKQVWNQQPDLTDKPLYNVNQNKIFFNENNSNTSELVTNHSNTNLTDRIGLWYNTYCSKTKMAVLMSFVGISLISIVLVLVVPGSSFLFEDPSAGQTGPLRVASFNIRHFGKSYMSQDDVVANVVKIFQRYDVILVIEVRDSSQVSLDKLKSCLNSDGAITWDYISSAPLGRTHYKEQYVFFYRPNLAKVVSSYQVTDNDNDVYEREPYAVEFEYTSKSRGDAKKQIVFMGIHTKPALAVSELKALPKDIKKVASHFSNSMGVITMGDYNADCGYVSQTTQNSLEIFHGADFRSEIPDSTDTTVSRTTDCAYDRIVIYGDGIDVRNSDVFNFEPLLKITTYEEAVEISDHYPVQFLLY